MSGGDPAAGFTHILFALALIGAGIGIYQLLRLAVFGFALIIADALDARAQRRSRHG